MHLVVHDEAPVAAVEQLEVPVFAPWCESDHLIRRNGDRTDFLALTGIFADLVLGQRGSRDQLTLPLPPETVLVTRIKVVALAFAIAAAPTSVLPAPQGSTTTPDPPAQNESTAIS